MDDPHKYDHSDHPTTHSRPDDLAPDSHAKKDDAVEQRGGDAFRRGPADRE